MSGCSPLEIEINFEGAAWRLGGLAGVLSFGRRTEKWRRRVEGFAGQRMMAKGSREGSRKRERDKQNVA